MPIPILASACKTCGHVYLGPLAIRQATDCEARGSVKFAFKKGDSFTRDGTKVTVLKRVVKRGPRSHAAWYSVHVEWLNEKPFDTVWLESQVEYYTGGQQE